MNKVTQQLRELSVVHQPNSPYDVVSQEDIEDARHFRRLADRNEAKTLSPEEANEVLEYFEHEPVIIRTEYNKCWVEYV